jgi:hypothetical protein
MVTVTGSIIAGNTAALSGRVDVGTQNGLPGRTFTSGGNNRLGNAAPGLAHDPNGNGDYIGTVDYIVTGIADTYNHANDESVVSLRDAIDLANTTAGAQEIWLPAWNFMLTRDRATFGGGSTTDMSVAFGDLDIGKSYDTSNVGGSLTIRGVNGSTSVAWKSDLPTDKLFELLGDYDNDGIANPPSNVDTSDNLLWRKGVSSADGNDDGVVDSLDYDVWFQNYGTSLAVHGIA